MRQLRREFTHQVLKKNYWEDEEQINKLFNQGMSANVNNILTKIQKRAFTNNLSLDFNSKMVIDGKDASKSKDEGTPAKRTIALRRAGNPQQQPTSLVERLHRGT